MHFTAIRIRILIASFTLSQSRYLSDKKYNIKKDIRNMNNLSYTYPRDRCTLFMR